MWRYVSFGAGVSSRVRRVRRKKGRIAATAAILAATLAGTSLAGAPAASASPQETVIVTATGLLSPVTAVLEVGGTILIQVPPHQRGRGPDPDGPGAGAGGAARDHRDPGRSR